MTAAAEDDPDRGMYLSNLGSALQLRYGRTGTPADLDAAIDAGEAAVAAAPASDTDRPAYMNILGIALQIRFGRTGVAAGPRRCDRRPARPRRRPPPAMILTAGCT